MLDVVAEEIKIHLSTIKVSIIYFTNQIKKIRNQKSKPKIKTKKLKIKQSGERVKNS